MRILHLISNMKSESGGPQEAVRMLLRYAPLGAHSEVATLEVQPAPAVSPLVSQSVLSSINKNPTSQGSPAEDLPRDGHTIHALGNTRNMRRWLIANRARFDGIVVHGLWEPLHLTVLLAIAGHTPYVVYPHGMLDPYFKRASPLKHAKKWLFWFPIQYWVLRRAHRVVFTTTAERDLAAQSFWLHRWNPAVVALGTEQPPQDLDRCRGAFFQLCPAARDQRYLLFLGRIDPKKGCDLLVSAFATISAQRPSLQLIIAGPDHTGWRTELEAIGAFAGFIDNIHWPGMLRGDAKWGAFAAAEAFILPSHQENFGIAIVEALACGTPALLTHPINIAADLAADNSALVEDDTLEGTQRLISRWLALAPEDRAAMQTNALTSVTTRYDMRKNTQALFDLFKETHPA